MNDLTRHLLADLDLHRASVREAVDSVPVEWRERRPEEGRWAVAEVLEHLAIIEGRVARMIAAAAGAAGPGDGPLPPRPPPPHPPPPPPRPPPHGPPNPPPP